MKYKLLRPKDPNRVIPDPYRGDNLPYSEAGRRTAITPYWHRLVVAGEVEDLGEETEGLPPVEVQPSGNQLASELLAPPADAPKNPLPAMNEPESEPLKSLVRSDGRNLRGEI